MIRTQIYLTEQEQSGLAELAEASGKKRSELIREAVDGLINQLGETNRLAAVDNAAGMWKDRKDLPNFKTIRQSLDRG